MLAKTSFRPLVLLLALALSLAGWMGCKASPEKEEEPATTADAGGEASPKPAPSTPQSQRPGGQSSPQAGDRPLAGQDLPAVVAKVNGQEIKKADLVDGVQAAQLQLAQRGRQVAPDAAFYRRVLNEVIGIILLQQEAKARGVRATDQEVQRQLEARKRAFPSEGAYEAALIQAGVTESALREAAGDQIAVQKYLAQEFGQDPEVSEQDVRQFYEQNKAQIQQPERLHLRHILVGVKPNASPAERQQARQQADRLLARLAAGEDFAKLAQESSDDQGSKARGGDLGWVRRGQTVPSFDKAAWALTQPNQRSPVVESPFGFHIIQLVERQAPAIAPYEQVKDDITRLLKEKKTQDQVNARIRELRQKAKVEIFI